MKTICLIYHLSILFS